MENFDTIIALGALIISIIALYKQSKFNKIQKNLSEVQIRVHNLELETRKKADVSAIVVKSKKDSTVKIFNQGNAIAHNIRVVIKDDNSILSEEELSRKFPYPALDIGGEIFLFAGIYLDRVNSIETIDVYWDDDFQQDNHKEVTLNF